MVHTVDLPNGETAEFPDDMSPDQISAVMQKQFPPAMQQNAQPVQQPQLSMGQRFGKGVGEFVQGGVQGLENTGIGIADLFGAGIPKAKWAPQTTPAKVGEFGADIGSYFLPGGILKGMRAIPYIGRAIKAAAKGLEGRPISNALVKGGGEGALFGAIQNPEDQKAGAIEGGGLGAGAQLLTNLVGSKNPFLNAIARTGLGAAAGAGIGGVTGQGIGRGAEVGAGLGFGAPYLKKELGFGKGVPGLETLASLEESKVRPAVEAGQRLGINLTPAEASGNPFIGAMEGRYGRTQQAAQEKTDIGLARQEQEKKSVNNLLSRIYKPTIANNNKIKSLYAEAYKSTLEPHDLMVFKSDPVIEEAFKKVESTPSLRKDLGEVSQGSFKYLDQVKRALDDMSTQASRSGSKNEARIINNTRDNFLETLDTLEPKYAEARREAQKKITREEIRKSLQKKEITGKNFYDTVLKNDDKYEQLLTKLNNVPEAQQHLRDMKLAFKNLSNIEKPSSAAFRSGSGLDQTRNDFTKLFDLWHELTGSKKNVDAIKFINSPKWVDEFSQIQNIKNKEQRNQKIIDMVGRLTSATGSKGLMTLTLNRYAGTE